MIGGKNKVFLITSNILNIYSMLGHTVRWWLCMYCIGKKVLFNWFCNRFYSFVLFQRTLRVSILYNFFLNCHIVFFPTTAHTDCDDLCCHCRTVLEWSCIVRRTPLRSLWMAYSVWVSAKKGNCCDFINIANPLRYFQAENLLKPGIFSL